MPTPMRQVVLCALFLGPSSGASATEQGLASFYGAWQAGDLTAAHRTLPMGTQVRVLNLDNGRVAVVKIVDRGPFIRGRIIDVSPAAAVTLGFRDAGLAHVKIVPLSAEMAAMEARVEAQPALAAYATSPDEICRYGAGDLDRDSSGDDAARLSNKLGCGSLQARPFSLTSGRDDWTVAAAFVARIPSSGVAAAASIPVSDLVEVAAAESISVSALLPPPTPYAASQREAMGCGDRAHCAPSADLTASKPAF